MADDPAQMAVQAQRCRRLADLSSDPQMSAGLNQLALDYERRRRSAQDERDRTSMKAQPRRSGEE